MGGEGNFLSECYIYIGELTEAAVAVAGGLTEEAVSLVGGLTTAGPESGARRARLLHSHCRRCQEVLGPGSFLHARWCSDTLDVAANGAASQIVEQVGKEGDALADPDAENSSGTWPHRTGTSAVPARLTP